MATAYIENEAGYVVIEGCTTAEVVAREQSARTLARTTCSRLALELAATNPQRAAELVAAAEDPTRTAHELWGVAKNDGRPPRPPGPANGDRQKETR